MPANSSLQLTSLDFDTLKNNFTSFMTSQSVFKDYNFAGPNISVLMDLLAYNTYLNSFYLNMVASEAFLDSAQLRSSVVSIAKELNYLPRSARSSRSLLDVYFTTNGINGIFTIPEGTMFAGKNSNGTFLFVTDQTHTLLSAGTEYIVKGLGVYEGKVFTESFVVDNSIDKQKFVLSNQNIDITSLKVNVISNSGQSNVVFLQATNLVGLDLTSTVFFVQEDRNSYYEIYFGDGVFGQVPSNGSTITVSYRVTKGAVGNGITKFNLANDLGPPNGGLVIKNTANTNITSQDGSDIEDIESIRYRAPKHYQVQGRAITVSDYRDLVLENFPTIKDVGVFGGEDVSGSVQYGTIFLSMTTMSGAPLSDELKSGIIDFLNQKKSLAVKLSIVNPDYVYLTPSITVYVDFSRTSLSAVDISTNVLKNVVNYNSDNLKVFNSKFMLSKFSYVIDNTDASIIGSETRLSMYKNVLFSNGFPQTITISFQNSIIPGTITSTDFILFDGKEYTITDFNIYNNTVRGQLINGVFKIISSDNSVYFNQVSTNNVQNYVKAGLVDYGNGALYIQSINVYDFMNPAGIRVSAIPSSDEVYGLLNNVIEIDTSNVFINVVAST